MIIAQDEHWLLRLVAVFKMFELRTHSAICHCRPDVIAPRPNFVKLASPVVLHFQKTFSNDRNVLQNWNSFSKH